MTTKLQTDKRITRAYPEEEALIENARVRSDKRMTAREWIGSCATALGFLAAAAACALVVPWPRELDPWLAVGLVGAYALSSRVRFFIGAGYTVPTQVVGVLPDLRNRKLHPERAQRRGRLVVRAGAGSHSHAR